MAGFSADMLRTIDQMMASRRDRVTAVGTVTSRSAISTDNRLSVAFDGSSLSVPVKQFAGVMARAGDRVGLLKFGVEWVVVGTFTATDPEDVAYLGAAAIGSTTSATYVATPSAEEVTFVKAWDDTNVRMAVNVGVYANASTTGVAFGLRFAELALNYDVAQLIIDTASAHKFVAGLRIEPGIPAGTYTVQLQWKRSFAGSTVQQDANDWVSFGVSEVGP